MKIIGSYRFYSTIRGKTEESLGIYNIVFYIYYYCLSFGKHFDAYRLSDLWSCMYATWHNIHAWSLLKRKTAARRSSSHINLINCVDKKKLVEWSIFWEVGRKKLFPFLTWGIVRKLSWIEALTWLGLRFIPKVVWTMNIFTHFGPKKIV